MNVPSRKLSLGRLGVALLALSAWLPSQLRIGMCAPELPATEQVRCEGSACMRLDAARLTVVAFYRGRPELLAGDVGYLDTLAHRYGDQGVQFVVVLATRDGPGAGLLDRCVLVDDGGLGETEWCHLSPSEPCNLVAVDQDGVVVFVGAPGCGLQDMIERALSDRSDPDYEERVGRWRVQLAENYDDLASGPTIDLLAPMVEQSPRDGLLTGLLYLTYATKADDLVAARALRKRAITAMADAPRALAVFADLALRGDPRRREVWVDLLPALERVAPAALDDPLVQLALLRARVADRDHRAAGRLAMTCRKVACATAAGCLDFAMLLAQDELPMVHRDLAESAVSRAKELGGDARLVAAARHIVALRCAEDGAAAAQLMDRYVLSQQELYSVNNDAWAFLTELPTMGRYDWFAVGLVERLLEDPVAMDYFEFDTAALAMFLVGRLGDAIDLQESAIDQGGLQEAAYLERLARYEAYRKRSSR